MYHPALPSQRTPRYRWPPTTHALLTSHHFKTPSKRCDLLALVSFMRLAGFAKLRHLGVLYAAGVRPAVKTRVRYVRTGQWLALRVRFVERLDGGPKDAPRWEELERIGEAVEWMRTCGREHFAVEMGI